MNHVPTRRGRRALASAAVLALLSLLAVGCGDDGGEAEAQETDTVVVDADGNVIDGTTTDAPTSPETDDVDTVDDSGPALTQEQLEAVVLTPDNVGDGWDGGPIESDQHNDAPGCFGELATVSDSLDPIEVAEYDVEYVYGDEGFPVISSGASSYEDGNEVAGAFEDLHAVLSTCTSVSGTDGDGNTWDLAVTYDATVVSDATDDQINITASGTVADLSGGEFDLTLHQSYVRIGKNIMTIGTTDLSDQTALHEAYAEIAIDRLVDVIIDSEPAVTTGPQPT